jgi:ATP-dependent HslUV protease subunit HslV
MARRNDEPKWRSTTIVAVRRGDKVAMAGDGQVTFGDTILKHTARKVRRLFGDKVIAGFAGAAADAGALLDKFEERLEDVNGNLLRAAAELAKDWRTDRILRRLEAMIIVADADHCLLISGNGDVIEPEDGVVAVGSGAPYALAAARALITHTELEPAKIVEESIRIAAEICLYTNDEIVVEEI